jgi:hypothetical protein
MKLIVIVATFCLHFLPYEVLGSLPDASLYCVTNPNDQNAEVNDDRYRNCTAYCETEAASQDVTCEYRRGRNLKAVNTDDLVNEASPKCLNAEYDLFVVSEQNHFALLATPPPQDGSGCPNVVMHSVRARDDRSKLVKSIATVDDSEVASVSEDAKLHLAARKLSLLLGAYEAVDIELNGSTKYDDVYNNCGVFPRAMLKHLDIPMDDRVIGFAAKHIIESSMLERVRASPSFQAVTADGKTPFPPDMTKDEMAMKLIDLSYH